LVLELNAPGLYFTFALEQAMLFAKMSNVQLACAGAAQN